MALSPMTIRDDLLNHVAIRASAGSGKTYQLVSRYLRLIAVGVPPASILASTFTRLAAGQIRDRILMALAEAADHPESARELADRLGLKKLDRDTVTEILAHLARNLHRMQVRTLDSFFAAIVRGFAVELDLPLGATVIDEAQDAQIRHEAIRLMLDERKPQELVDLLRRLIQDRAEREVCKTINDTVAKLHGLYLETHPEAWECVPQPKGRLTPLKVIDAIRQLESCAIASDRKALHKAWISDLQEARAQKWRDFLKDGISGKLAAGETSYGRTTIDDDIIDAYQPLVNHARAVIIGRIRDQTLATRDLLALFDQHCRIVKNAQRAITFADLTSAMARAEHLGTLDAICFRIDATLRHMLLDEFQDTSIPQWRALERLVKEIICVAPPERSFFCVGDVKQSIYGWRSAAPEVLDELPHLLVGPDGTSAIATETLSKSYRSSPVIMAAVNRVFKTLGSNRALNDCRDAERAWSAGFEHHTTAKDYPGYAELRMMPRIEGNAKARLAARCKVAAQLVAELHHANRHMSIAVLARSNKVVARMLYELGPGPGRLNIPVTGRGGGPLTDAPAVNAILDLLQLADHPDDTIAAFNVARSPVGRMIGLAAHDDDRQRCKVAQTVRRQLLNEGYGATIAQWIAKLAPSCDERELGRLVQLVELAGTHDPQPSLRPGEFIQRVEDTRVPSSQPAPVQVMTIHQSKGLEFDAVILPELESKLVGKAPPVVFERDGETGPISRICCNIRTDVRGLLPELQPLFGRYGRRTARESLSLLYVAMTRAIRALYMFIDPPEVKTDGSLSDRYLKTAAGVLRCALVHGEIKAGDVVYSEGEAKWMTKFKIKDTTTNETKPRIDTIRLAKPIHAGTRGGKARSASQLADVENASASISLINHEAREHGTVMHAMFEQIEWLEDFKADADLLMSIARRKAGRRDESWRRTQVESFMGALKHAAVIDTLSRNGRNRSHLEVHREHPFARIVDGGVQQGMIDRLVVELDSNGKAISASIIDFKTDAVTAAECAECAQHYLKQMNTYREVAAAWLGIEPRTTTRSLLFVVPGVRVDL